MIGPAQPRPLAPCWSHRYVPWCHLGLPSLLPLPHVHPSALSPKHFPNPATSLYLVPPASALASRCNLPPAICSSPGSHKDIFKTANHILSLSRLACGSSTSEQNPHSSPPPPRRPGPCDLPPVSPSIFRGSPVHSPSARFLQHGQLVPAPGSLHCLFSPPPCPSQLAPSYTSCLNCVIPLGKPSLTITPSCN